MTERRCILTGRTDNPDSMIRLALGPEGQIAPDVRAKAPGRGAWLGVARAELEQAMEKGQLKAGLARSFRLPGIAIPDDLAEGIDAALRHELLHRLGLEARASNIVTGSEKIDVAARRGQLHLLLHAGDAAPDGCRKLDQAWRVGRMSEGSGEAGISLFLDRHALSGALGRDNVVHIGVTDARAAQRIVSLLDRWQCYRGCAIGGPAEPASVDHQ